MDKKWIFLHGPFILLILFTVIVFYPGITPSFSSDDYVHLLNNTQFKSIDQALGVFTEPYGREYRPLVRISLWINHLMDETAIAFKITNLLLHIITTFFVYRILNSLTFSKAATILGAAIFALHPIHVTSIHFILGRTDLIAAVFYFGTLALVAEWKDSVTAKEYLAAMVLFIAALLSKEMSITLCLMMLALVLYKQQDKNLTSLISAIAKLSPFFVLTVGYIIVRVYMWSKITSDVAVYTNYTFSHIVNNYLSWLFSLIYPFDLYIAQDFMIENPKGFIFAVMLFGCIIVAGLAISSGRKVFEVYRSFWLWFSILWISITLLPICGGNPHRWYLYIPSFGLSILIAAVVEKTQQPKQKITLLAIGLLLIIYSVEDYRLSKIWSKQSEINTVFLEQIKTKQLYKKENIYFANVPFGFKSAYLFTYSSLEEAIQYYFGQSPKIVAVSYVNISDDINIRTTIESKNINFKMHPDHYNFFLLSANERRFEDIELNNEQRSGVKINAISGNKKISDYTITMTEAMQNNFYYFDGEKIKSISDFEK